MKNVASCSFGKDSLATVLLALEHDEPLDNPASVRSIQQARTSEEALTKEAALDPSCVIDIMPLTLINRHGTYGARQKGGFYR